MGCDQGAKTARGIGPELRLVAVSPAPGAGLDCGDASDCGVPLDAAIELRFDRPLLPSTVARSRVAVYPQGVVGTLFLEPEYDVIERVVTYRMRGGRRFEPDLLYQLDIVAGEDGFRAYDGAPLEATGSSPQIPFIDGGSRFHFSFRTAAASPPLAPPEPPPPDCADFNRVLSGGICLDCHGQLPETPMGLRLGSAADLQSTAIGRIAHETDNGATGGRILVDPDRFGVGMAIIAPGDPASSYLLYKVLVNTGSYAPDGCTTVHDVPLPNGTCVVPTTEEVSRMRDWFVKMDPMPPPRFGTLTLPDLRLVQEYIRAGAPLDGCP